MGGSKTPCEKVNWDRLLYTLYILISIILPTDCDAGPERVSHLFSTFFF